MAEKSWRGGLNTDTEGGLRCLVSGVDVEKERAESYCGTKISEICRRLTWEQKRGICWLRKSKVGMKKSMVLGKQQMSWKECCFRDRV